MSTTILTDEQIMHLWDTRVGDPTECMPLVDSDKTAFARAIKQAVLQSPEIQALRKDAERYRATRAGLVGTDPEYGSRFCKYCDAMGIEQAKNITEEQFDAATDAAMERKA